MNSPVSVEYRNHSIAGSSCFGTKWQSFTGITSYTNRVLISLIVCMLLIQFAFAQQSHDTNVILSNEHSNPTLVFDAQ